ncbi:hypothetical protein [Nocardia testacea]|uniref:hypothetical protein n=1 Tax=Nocardia testacea TaxID=248551 RepID=UPI0005858AF4|nr:hypothetical protein [Nocardia testacea]
MTNKTDTRATLYDTDDCQFAYRSTVEPGDDFYKGGTFFKGVIFGDTTVNDREKRPERRVPVEPGGGVQDDSPSGDEDPWVDDRPSEGEVG